MRNLLFGARILGSIEPEWFQGIFQAIPEGDRASDGRTESAGQPFWLLRRAFSKDSLRGLAAAVAFLQAFGRHLHASEKQPTQTTIA